MTINEYLVLLEEELKYLPKKKRKLYVNLYLNRMNTELDNGVEENKITASMPEPSELAQDIYKQEEIDYDKRKKQQDKTQAIFTMLLNVLIFILTVSGFIILSIYLVYSSIKLIQLIILVSSKEKLLISLLDITIIIFYLTLLIYLFDLVVLIIESSIEKIALGFNKEIHLKDFSLVYLINKLFKKEHVMRTIFIVEGILLLTFGITNVACKTYVYRAFYKEAPTAYTKVIEEEYIYKTINVDVDEARINFILGENFKVEVFSEFERNINLKLDNDILIITTDEIKTFDLLQLLKEPIPVINIYIKNDSSIKFLLNNGIVSVNTLTLDNLDGNIMLGNILIDNLKVNNVNIKDSQKTSTSMKNCEIKEFTYSSYNGSLELFTSKIDNISISCNVPTINMEENEIHSIDVKTYGDFTSIKNIIDDASFQIGTCDLFINGGEIKNSMVIKSSLKGNVSIGNITAPEIVVTTVGGDVVGRNIKSDLKIETGSNLTLSKIEGNVTAKALGNFVQINEIKGSNVTIQAERSETAIKFVKCDAFKYTGVNAKSTLYFIFAKTLKAYEQYGNLHIDNDKSIISSDDDISLYNEYYQEVESKDISATATERVYVKGE